MKLVYVGRSDARVLAPEDFNSEEIVVPEVITFRQGQPVEISETFGAFLLTSPSLKGEFKLEGEEEGQLSLPLDQ